MKFYQETTEWSDSTPNHVYLLNDSKDRMFGYSVGGRDKLTLFKSPILFDARRRKFKVVQNKWNWTAPELVKTDNTWEIRSSSGNVYTIEKNGSKLSCSCSGFKFRGKCKHVDAEKSKEVENA